MSATRITGYGPFLVQQDFDGNRQIADKDIPVIRYNGVDIIVASVGADKDEVNETAALIVSLLNKKGA